MKHISGLLALLIGLVGFASLSFGHALEPGYLELRLLNAEQYGVIWKVPSNKTRPMDISASLPESCETRNPRALIWEGSAYVARWTTKCSGGIEGGVIRIEGLEQTETDVLVRFDFADGVGETHRLTSSSSFFTVPTQPNNLEVVQTYLILGFKHILSGIDHLAFVLALLILVNNKRRLIITVTAFTIAHSLTLAGATLGYIQMPGPPIEAAIALSIVFVATEIIHSRRGNQGLTEKFPWIVAFTFGLLHGFGFAGALAQIGLPQTAIPIALLFFNIGVEIGQLFFIAIVFSIITVGMLIMRYVKSPEPTWIWTITPYIIGSFATFWVFQRLAVF